MLRSITKSFLFLALAAATVMSCDNDGGSGSVTPEEAGEYAISFSADNGSQYLLSVKDLTSGEISPVGKGVDVTSIFTWGENIVQKGKFFYHLDPNAGKFGKYKFENDVLTTISEIAFTEFPSPYLGWHVWISENQLMFGPRSSNLFSIINTETMTIVKSGQLDQSKVPAGHTIRIFSAVPKNNQLLFGFGLYNEETRVHYDSTYLASVNLPNLDGFSMKSRDGRSAPMGTLRNGYYSQFVDGDDTYIMTIPIPRLGGNKPKMPTGFYKVGASSSELDKNYFFNTSAQFNMDNQLGVINLGNGKAIIINAHDAATNVKTGDDWWYAAMWQYYVVDYRNQKVLKKLDFPLLMNSRSSVVHNGVAHIAVNDPNADAVYVWAYDPDKDTLTKGLKVIGSNDDTPILYKLN